ncbi:single-stranded DNA-binding protein [Nocardioides jensenii]|uniref:single-stranded DNA-binding protein n=1 Tax=Nocardioides jensenii TaxID=1843 RepID=UPI0008348346|nr:single-stranded DNA-binding protein [Nocardioides jensenii]
MNETMITFQGWVGSEVNCRDAGGSPLATFRVASTPRRFNRSQQNWVDGETNWYTVNAWRTLALNCAESLESGQAVVVFGRLNAQVWRDDNGVDRLHNVVEAIAVGHDFTRGTAQFHKSEPGSRDGIDPQVLAEANAAMGVGGPQVTSNGQTLDDLVVKEDAEAPAA